MPTAWKIRDKTIGGSGPTWDAMSTDDTDDYDALTTHKWDWASDWTIFAKSTSDIGIVWSGMSYTWVTDPTVYAGSPWTIMNLTKIQAATET